MPIGAVTAAVTVGGAVLSSSAQKKAAKKAAGAAKDNTAANNALAREMYGNNAARLDPYSANGMRASNALTEMLLGPAPATAAPVAAAPAGGGTVPARGVLGQGTQQYAREGFGNEWAGGNGARHLFQRLPGFINGTSAVRPPTTTPPLGGGLPGTAPATATPAPNALSPWDRFRNSTNYQFRVNEGMDGINQGYAARGMLQSGAALQGIEEYRQNFAANELGRYQDLLAQQQGVGMGAASALAGVGQNMVGQVTANNNSGASAAANAALMRGQANSNMWGGIAQGIGGVLGGMGGSSYGPR